MLPSWQAYSYRTYLSLRVQGKDMVQGAVRTSGSSTCASYCKVLGPVGVRRSTMCSWRLVGTGWLVGPTITIGATPLKLRVSMTRVFPSKWPRDEPSQVVMAPGRGVWSS